VPTIWLAGATPRGPGCGLRGWFGACVNCCSWAVRGAGGYGGSQGSNPAAANLPFAADGDRRRDDSRGLAAEADSLSRRGARRKPNHGDDRAHLRLHTHAPPAGNRTATGAARTCCDFHHPGCCQARHPAAAANGTVAIGSLRLQLGVSDTGRAARPHRPCCLVAPHAIAHADGLGWLATRAARSTLRARGRGGSGDGGCGCSTATAATAGRGRTATFAATAVWGRTAAATDAVGPGD
jgi:hypothetical protein